ncbi:hypothetical protein K1719_004122 [Acacia pycnantha]|nr:hypothetical protein K1719_004122 [Acacia pycnantha]
MDALQTKEDAPTLTEDELRSTKKVRIRTGATAEAREEGQGEPDVHMTDSAASAGVSYRSKLLNGGQTEGENQKQPMVQISEEDYKIDKEGEVPSIEFSDEVKAALAKGMERSVIIKLLGRSITFQELTTRTQLMWKLKGSVHIMDMERSFFCATFALEEDYLKVLTGGPWMIYGAYLTVQPWSLDFNAQTDIVSKVVAWVRIPRLSIRYYHKSTLRAIGALLGEVVKIDYMTESRGRGKYARIAIIIDLLKPLIPCIKVDGRSFYMEYEGLPQICFKCGKYGHLKERCGDITQQGVSDRTHGHAPMVAPTSELQTTSPEDGVAGSGGEGSQYGSWMIVKYPKRSNTQYRGKRRIWGDQRLMADQGLITGLPRSKPNSHGVKSGQPRQAQVYRPKLRSTEKEPILPNKNLMEDQPQVRSQAVVEGSGVSPIDKPCAVGVLTRTVEPEKKLQEVLPTLKSVFLPIQTTSSLEQAKHTVMILQSRKALDENNQMTSNLLGMSTILKVPTLDEGKEGKENGAIQDSQKRHGPQGIKLQSSIRRNLKIQRLLAQDWRVTVNHVYREGNRCADFLASFALTLEEGLHSLEHPPADLQRLLSEDMEGLGVLRLCSVIST